MFYKLDSDLFNTKNKFDILNLKERRYIALDEKNYYDKDSFEKTAKTLYEKRLEIISKFGVDKMYLERFLYSKDNFFKYENEDIKSTLAYAIDDKLSTEDIKSVISSNEDIYIFKLKEDSALKMVYDSNKTKEENFRDVMDYADQNDYMDALHFNKTTKHHEIYLGCPFKEETQKLIIHPIYQKIHFG